MFWHRTDGDKDKPLKLRKGVIIITSISLGCAYYMTKHAADPPTIGGIAMLEVSALCLELIYNKIKDL